MTAQQPQYECEMCGQVLYSYRAMMMCEEQDIEDQKNQR